MATNPDRVAVLITEQGDNLIIRANPTQKAVKNFIVEHNRRYRANEPGGPSGEPAQHIVGAEYYPSELEINDPEKAKPINVKSIL